MDSRHFTPRERIEARREERESRRSFVRHYYLNPFRIWELVLEYLAWKKVEATKKPLELKAQLLKALSLIPKFCNGLTGASLTDPVPANN